MAGQSIENHLLVFRARWESYVAGGRFEQFVEFAVALNSLAEHFNRLRLPGLVRLSEGLENTTLAKLGDPDSHPIAPQDMVSLQRQVDTLLGSTSTLHPAVVERRGEKQPESVHEAEWIKRKPRLVWLIAHASKHDIAEALGQQLRFFGFSLTVLDWEQPLPEGTPPLAVLFFPASDSASEHEIACIAKVREACTSSQLFYLGVQTAIDAMVALIRAGIDIAVPATEQPAMMLNRILDLVQSGEREKYRVLVVEDSRVAVALIQRTLHENGIDSRAIGDPSTLLEVLESYRPDLILMDMYMPRFNGVEATRVLRQMSAYHSLPIVYLSGESDIGMQVKALRLGGDQFLSKPFNPVLLAAVVTTSISRYREVQRSSQIDGLTGLLNHTSAKSSLKSMVNQMPQHGKLVVVMLDIDFFKAVNDTYGHPVGDQVIRALAWLLKGRLRSSDLIGRYGGEEFLIALPQITLAQAHTVIDRIRTDFSALPHAHAGGALYVTFSAGMAAYSSAETAESLTKAADAALLNAKRLGRNCVEQAKSL
ncbi:MAG: diguanylate cyclase [Formivibrio sp.]|nr:diguanylate cyclase [Formivibrio sp.]